MEKMPIRTRAMLEVCRFLRWQDCVALSATSCQMSEALRGASSGLRVDVDGEVEDRGLEMFLDATSTGLASRWEITSLRIVNCVVASGDRLLASIRSCTQIRTLTIMDCRITSGDLSFARFSCEMNNLREVFLKNVPATYTCNVIRASPKLHSFTIASLPDFSTEDLMAIADVLPGTRIRSLAFENCRFTDNGVQQITAAIEGTVTRLAFSTVKYPLTDVSAQALGSCRVAELSLLGAMISANGLGNLFQTTNLVSLTCGKFSGSLLDDSRIAKTIPLASRLRKLVFWGEQIGDETVKSVAKNLQLLQEFKVLWSPSVTDSSVEALEQLQHLSRLSFDKCRRVSDRGIAKLVSRCRVLEDLSAIDTTASRFPRKVRKAEKKRRELHPDWKQLKLSL
eukprot:g3866.t1